MRALDKKSCNTEPRLDLDDREKRDRALGDRFEALDGFRLTRALYNLNPNLAVALSCPPPTIAPLSSPPPPPSR
ncbi:hypothetical protein AKJ16_DCAP17653 [Drosera capensis]